MINLHRFANPGRFQRLADRLLPWCAGGAALALAVGLYIAFFVAPPDYQQGESVRIMYVHVPSAWMALFTYVMIAVASACSLIWRHPLADLAARAASPLGAGFAFLTLVTGSLWGEPMWGTWWVWDARLTSMLLLFFLYLGHMALMNAFEDPQRGYRSAAHPGPGRRHEHPDHQVLGGLVVDPAPAGLGLPHGRRRPSTPRCCGRCCLMAVGFKLYFVTLLLVRMKSEILAARVRALQLTHMVK